MRVANRNMMMDWLGLRSEDLANRRLLCQVYSSLYANLWCRNPIQNGNGEYRTEWEYIGDETAASAIGEVAAAVKGMSREFRSKSSWSNEKEKWVRIKEVNV